MSNESVPRAVPPATPTPESNPSHSVHGTTDVVHRARLHHRHRRRARWTAALIGLPVLFIAAACGGSSSTTSAAGPTTTASGQAAFTAYRNCLSKHGVKLPAGGFRGRRSGSSSTTAGSGSASGAPSGAPGGSGSNSFFQATPAMQAAQKACASLRPKGGFGGFGGRSGAGLQAFQAFASCMKDHGITIPTGGFGRSGSSTSSTTGSSTTVDRSSPAYQAASKACAALLPTRSPAGSSSTTATTAKA